MHEKGDQQIDHRGKRSRAARIGRDGDALGCAVRHSRQPRGARGRARRCRGAASRQDRGARRRDRLRPRSGRVPRAGERGRRGLAGRQPRGGGGRAERRAGAQPGPGVEPPAARRVGGVAGDPAQDRGRWCARPRVAGPRRDALRARLGGSPDDPVRVAGARGPVRRVQPPHRRPADRVPGRVPDRSRVQRPHPRAGDADALRPPQRARSVSGLPAPPRPHLRRTQRDLLRAPRRRAWSARSTPSRWRSTSAASASHAGWATTARPTCSTTATRSSSAASPTSGCGPRASSPSCRSTARRSST
jgi:hypothetical protein